LQTNSFPERELATGRAIRIKPIYVQLSILLIALIGLYFPVLRKLVGDLAENDNYSHWYLVPVIFAYMIWSVRRKLQGIPCEPRGWGLLVVTAGLFQLLVASVGAEYFLQRTSLLVVLFGIVVFLFGIPAARIVSVPILYLIFMIPVTAIIWNRIAFPMQIFASLLTEQVVRLIGIPLVREGNILHLAQTTLEVVDACSGLRSLVTMLALSGALAFVVPLPRWKKWVLFLSAFPIAIAVNIIRLTVTAILANTFGADVAQGFLHDFSGLLVFVAGIVLLVMVQAALGRTGRNKLRREPVPGGKSVL